MAQTPISLKPGLYVAATPIGNLGDITYRAVDVLKAADLILCEDTRQTAKLCAAYGIDTPRTAYHDHNGARVRPGIIKKLQQGAVICLVSDAGTPLISDPGYKLVSEARDAGIDVIPLPGPSAVIAALCAAGAPSNQFMFAGFLPNKPGARERMLAALSGVDATLVFYETGPRLGDSLNAMAATLGNREAVIARELTKIHETFHSGDLESLAAECKSKAPKGEIVVLVTPPGEQQASSEELDEFLRSMLADKPVKEAAAAAAMTLNVPRKLAYTRALDIQKKQ